MIDVVPSIARLTAISTFPQLTALVLSLAWSAVPFQVVYFLTSRNVKLDADRIRTRPWLFGFAIVIGAVGFMAMLFFMREFTLADISGETKASRTLRFITTSRLGLVANAGLFSTFFSMMATLLLLFCWHIPEGYFRDKRGL
jgi:hypothetical protein